MPVWTNVPKPVESSVIVLGTLGEPFGLLMAITSIMTSSSSITTGCTNISKPTGSGWTNVAKPTGSGWTNIAKPIS